MPVKARRPKRRATEAAELAAWKDAFECGYDFFNDAGFAHQEHTPEFWAAARAAWKRLGSRFMEAWHPTDVREKPWALEEFGRPSCR